MEAFFVKETVLRRSWLLDGFGHPGEFRPPAAPLVMARSLALVRAFARSLDTF